MSKMGCFGGSYGSSEVIKYSAIRQNSYEVQFLTFHSNYIPILDCFWDIVFWFYIFADECVWRLVMAAEGKAIIFYRCNLFFISSA